jgi:cobalamin biosynthesis Mg chelatase CobN
MPDGEVAYCSGGRNFHFVDTAELPKTTAQDIFDICKKSLIQDFENKAGKWYQQKGTRTYE